MQLIRVQQLFESRAFRDLCWRVVFDCEDRRCDILSDNHHAKVISPCTHDIASHDARVKWHNRFGIVPFWYGEVQDFESKCRKIVADCDARRCPSPCGHGYASHDVQLEALGDNRFGLVPFWHPDWKPPQTDGFIGDNPYAHNLEPDEAEERAQTPLWDADHEYPPRWNPADDALDDSIYSAWIFHCPGCY